MNLEFNNNHFILGGKYKIFDIPNNQELNVQIVELNDVELMYKYLDEKDKFLYRELEEIKLIDIIDEDLANKLNKSEVFSVQTNEIKAILGRKEIEFYAKDNFSKLNLDENTVIISITDPKSNILDEDIFKNFKDSLSIQFYDITEDMIYNTNENWKFVPINNEETKIILDFILKHKHDNFLIHCEKGQSRSAGVGLAIECILKFNGNKKEFSLEPSMILNHHRYEPNMYVFDKILEEFNKVNQ